MDSSGVQIQLDPIAPPEAPKSRDVAPGKKRNEQGETRDTAAAAALTASFAEILQSKRLDLKTGAEGQSTEESAIKTKKAGLKEGKEALTPVQSQLAAGKKKVKLPALEVQAKETLDHAKELAGQAMKAAPANSPGKDSADAAQPAELAKKGALTPAEEALLKEVIQKQGSVAGQKKAAQTTAFVNGEPLNRREGIGTVKSMMAKEGEVLKNLSGGEEAQAPQKTKGRSARTQQPSVPREAPENEGKAAQATPFAETVRQELAGRAENAWEKLAAAGEGNKQQSAGTAQAEIRDVPAGTGAVSAPPLGRGLDNPTPARPQAVVSQVLEGATQILRSGSGRLVMSLQPPQLGTLDLDVVVQDNRVKMVMLADNQEVKQMLQAGMDDLRNALQDKGFQIDRMEVLVQNRPDGGAGQDFWQEAGFAREEAGGRGRHKHEQESERAAQGPAVRPVRAGDSGLSVFA